MAQNQPTGWVGWVYFAGILMLVRGFFQAFIGIVALANSDIFVVGANGLAVFNYTAWGWIHIGLSVVLLTGAASVFSGKWWGRLVGSIMTSLALFANLAFLPAHPLWSISLAIVDVLMLYALTVRGGEARN